MAVNVRLDSKYDPDHGWYFEKSPFTVTNTGSNYQYLALNIDEARSLTYQLELAIAQYDQKKGE